MGRIAELFEKKALGTLSEAEKKELASLLAEAKAAEGGDDGGEGTPAEGAEGDDLQKQIDQAAQKMADIFQEKIDNNNAALKDILSEMKAAGAPVSTKSVDGKYFVNKELGEKSMKELKDIKVVVPGREGKKFKEVSMQTTEFLKAFFANDVQKLQILSEGTAADGGYLVPEEWANMIIEDRRDANIMRQIAAPVINVHTDTFHLPSLASRPKATWRNEKAVKNTSTASFGETVFTPHSLAAIVPLTNEFVADASVGVGASVVNYIAGLLGVSLAEAEEQAFWTGSGTGQPKGVNQYSLRTVTAVSPSDSDRADAIIAGKARTPQGYRQRAVWVANMGTYENIGQLKDSQNRYLLSDLAGAETQLLKGRPVYESNYLEGGAAYFGDYSYYQIVDREGIAIKVSDEAVVAGVSAFEKNLTFIRAEERVDGQLVLPAAVTKVAGLGTP
jgi:HK97 family phage major capsid protein